MTIAAGGGAPRHAAERGPAVRRPDECRDGRGQAYECYLGGGRAVERHLWLLTFNVMSKDGCAGRGWEPPHLQAGAELGGYKWGGCVGRWWAPVCPNFPRGLG